MRRFDWTKRLKNKNNNSQLNRNQNEKDVAYLNSGAFSGIDSHQAASHTVNPVHPNVTRCGSVSQLLFLPPAAKAAPVT